MISFYFQSNESCFLEETWCLVSTETIRLIRDVGRGVNHKEMYSSLAHSVSDWLAFERHRGYL